MNNRVPLEFQPQPAEAMRRRAQEFYEKFVKERAMIEASSKRRSPRPETAKEDSDEGGLRRFDETLKRMLSTPPLHKRPSVKGKTKQR